MVGVLIASVGVTFNYFRRSSNVEYSPEGPGGLGVATASTLVDALGFPNVVLYFPGSARNATFHDVVTGLSYEYLRIRFYEVPASEPSVYALYNVTYTPCIVLFKARALMVNIPHYRGKDYIDWRMWQCYSRRSA